MSKYSRKHPPDTEPDPKIVEAIQSVARNGRMSCVVAHELARELQVTPAEIGKTLDLLEYRIVECQMGIFGYSPEKKILEAAQDVRDGLREHLAGSTHEESISCASCWQIADACGLQRTEVAAACDSLGIKIKPCQLGAF